MKNNPYKTKRLIKTSRKKSKSERKLLNNFLKENEENLYNDDINEMYSDSLKYNLSSINGDLKTAKKYSSR